MVHRTCKPYNTIRKVRIVVLGVLFVRDYFVFPTLFSLHKLNRKSALILIVFGLRSWPVMKAFGRLNDHIRTRLEAWRACKTAKAASERMHGGRRHIGTAPERKQHIIASEKAAALARLLSQNSAQHRFDACRSFSSPFCGGQRRQGACRTRSA